MSVTTAIALRPLAGLLAVLTLLLSGCGGGSDGGGGGGGGLSEKRAGELAKQYVLDTFGILTGDVNPQRLIDAFAPECREGVAASEIAAAVGFISIFLPQLAEVKIEDVDLGKLTFEKTDEGILVRPEDANAVRIKVKGKFVNANEFFGDLGFDSVEDTPAIAEDALLIVERDGKAYLGNCSELQDFGGGGSSEDLDFNATPTSFSPLGTPGPAATRPAGTPGGTAVPATNRPGGTRAAAVRLGSSVVVEETWRISVVSVNRDALAALEATASLLDPPAADERFVLVTVKVENVSKDDEAQSIADYQFEMTGSRNRLYSGFDEASCGLIGEALSADLFPGGQASGDVCFKIPRDETNLLLVWDGFIEGSTFLKLD